MKKNKFGKEYFSSGNYGSYRKEAKRWVPKVARKIAKIINKKKASVLDVGCAHGYLIAEFQNKYGFQAAGIDFSKYAIQNAEPSVKKNVKQGNILHFNFHRNSFDALITLDVINYLALEEIEKGVKNLAKVSRKYIFFGAIFKHAWTASQKWNPDEYRKTALTKKEYIEYFKKNGFLFKSEFDGDNGGNILIFQKRGSNKQ